MHGEMLTLNAMAQSMDKNLLELINFGAVNNQAIALGLSSKGYWRFAETYGSQNGLTNAYLKEQVLVSARELWITFHYPNG